MLYNRIFIKKACNVAFLSFKNEEIGVFIWWRVKERRNSNTMIWSDSIFLGFLRDGSVSLVNTTMTISCPQISPAIGQKTFWFLMELSLNPKSQFGNNTYWLKKKESIINIFYGEIMKVIIFHLLWMNFRLKFGKNIEICNSGYFILLTLSIYFQ